MKRAYHRPQLTHLGLLRTMTYYSNYDPPTPPSDPPMPGLYGNNPSTTPPTDPSTGLPLPGMY